MEQRTPYGRILSATQAGVGSGTSDSISCAGQENLLFKHQRDNAVVSICARSPAVDYEGPVKA
jgi:hypothetical protein